MCLSIYLFNANVSIVQNKTQEQIHLSLPLFSLHFLQCRVWMKSRFGPMASGRAGKKSPRKLQRLSVLRYTGFLKGLHTSSGKSAAHPFWTCTGEMDACTMFQKGVRNPSLGRGRDYPVVNVEVLIMKCRKYFSLGGREMKSIVKCLFNQRRASTLLSHKYAESISL